MNRPDCAQLAALSRAEHWVHSPALAGSLVVVFLGVNFTKKTLFKISSVRAFTSSPTTGIVWLLAIILARILLAGILLPRILLPRIILAVIQAGVIQTGVIQAGVILAGAIQAGVIQTGTTKPGVIQAENIQAGLLLAENRLISS